MTVLKIIVLFVIVNRVCAVRQSTLQPNVTMDSNETKAATFRKYLVDCTEETKVNPDIVLKLRSGKWKRIRKEPLALKQWALCLLVKHDMMSRGGVLKQDVVLASVPARDRNKVEKAIDKCLYKKRHSAPDIAWHYIRCFRNRFPKYSIL